MLIYKINEIIRKIFKKEVYVVRIENHHNVEIEVFKKYQKADQCVFKYVLENWDEEVLGTMPDNKDLAIELYFKKIADEFYVIDLYPVQ